MNGLQSGVPQEVRKPARDWAQSSLELLAIGESHRHSAHGLCLTLCLEAQGTPGYISVTATQRQTHSPLSPH